jgi:hypothetical protein
MTSQPSVLSHDLSGLASDNDEEIERECGRRARWIKATLLAPKIKRAKRTMYEHRPAFSSNQPLNRNASAVSPQAIAALPVPHLIGGSATVKLRTAFSEPE